MQTEILGFSENKLGARQNEGDKTALAADLPRVHVKLREGGSLAPAKPIPTCVGRN